MIIVRLFLSFVALVVVVLPRAGAAELDGLVPLLREGGYVIIFRHGATDDSQKDVVPFRFDDMNAQRQLNENGRSTARDIGSALAKLAVPIGDVYTSRLNRGVETGKLIGGKDVSPTDALTDSSSGSASGNGQSRWQECKSRPRSSRAYRCAS